jgi:hypothetical protein
MYQTMVLQKDKMISAASHRGVVQEEKKLKIPLQVEKKIVKAEEQKVVRAPLFSASPTI